MWMLVSAVFDFGLSLYFVFLFFFSDCLNLFLLRLVLHTRRASPRALRVLRVLIERYSASSIVIALSTDDWEA